MSGAGLSWTYFFAITTPILSVIGTLVGVIWFQHSRRVDAIDRRVDAYRRDIGLEMKTHKDDVLATHTRLFDKLDHLAASISGVREGIEGLRADISGDFVTKSDCTRMHSKT